MEQEELVPIATLDLRGLNAVLETQDGDLLMLVDDGDVQIEFSSGLNGTWQQAVEGAERLAEAAGRFAAAIRQRSPAH